MTRWPTSCKLIIKEDCPEELQPGHLNINDVSPGIQRTMRVSLTLFSVMNAGHSKSADDGSFYIVVGLTAMFSEGIGCFGRDQMSIKERDVMWFKCVEAPEPHDDVER